MGAIAVAVLLLCHLAASAHASSDGGVSSVTAAYEEEGHGLATQAEGGAGRSLLQFPNTPLPIGWWYGMGTTYNNRAAWCGLRDFPPITNGYGTARLLCFGSYNNYYMWQILPVTGALPIRTGSFVYLVTWNPYYKYCATVRNPATQIVCGFPLESSTQFQVETLSGNPVFNQQTDKLFIKANGRYCRIKGQARKQYVYCDGFSRATAAAFSFPANSYGNVSLTSLGASNNGCGANAIPFDDGLSYVNCTQPASTANRNYVTSWMATFRVPPAVPVLVSGGVYTLKAYNSFQPYRNVVWYTDVTAGSPTLGSVYLQQVDLDGHDPTQWFTLAKPGAAPGTQLATGDIVSLWNQRLGKYCGTNAYAYVVCDSDNIATPSYLYVLTIN